MLYNVGDYPSIQAALDAAENDPCAVVEAPPTSYQLDAPLVIHSNTILRTYGSRIVPPPGEHRLLRAFRDTDSFPGYSGPHDITILGGTWDAQGYLAPPNTVVDAFNFCHARNITVKDATIRNVAGAHAIELSAVDGAILRDCIFEGYCDTGGREFSEAVQIGTTTSPAATDIGPWDNTPCRRISITNCQTGPSIELGPFGALAGDHSRAPGVRHEGIRIIDCDVDGALMYGIRPYSWRDFVVRGNTIRNTGGSSIIAQHCRDGVIEGNVIRGSGSNSINTSGSLGVLVGLNIINSTSTNYGIWVGAVDDQDSGDVLVVANSVAGAAAAAVRLSAGTDRSAVVANQLRKGSGGDLAISVATGVGTANRVLHNDTVGFGTNLSNPSGTVLTT